MPTSKKKRQQRVARGQQQQQVKAAPVKEAALPPRKPVYKEIVSVIYSNNQEEGPITVDKAKQLLGWEEEEEKKPFGNKHLGEISRAYGAKVRCTNNVANRPIYSSQLETLKQEILRGRWVFNGEPIIIGITGLILNGQHTLLALILAAKEWATHPDRWPVWTEAPTLDKLVIVGVAEDDDTVNTMDTCKPRSLADVIYRASYFKDLPGKAQKTVARMAQYAIKMMWLRTGIHMNAFAVRRTHAESVDFLNKHPQLLKAVRHIYEEDDDTGKIAKYLSPGYAAAALFLMGCSSTDAKSYYTAEDPGEQHLDLENWDRACEFFVELAGGAIGLKPVRDEIGKLISNGSTRWSDRWAVLAKAWQPYSNSKPVTAKAVALEFVVKDGDRHLVEDPTIGGIDVGEEGLHFVANGDPEKTDIEKRTKEVREKKFGKEKVAKRAGDKWAKGDTAWVHSSDGDPFFGTLMGEPYETENGPVKVFIDAEDGEWECDLDELSLAQFEKKT